MKHLVLLALSVMLFASCAPATAQATRPGEGGVENSSGEGGALDRVHVYEVDARQLEARVSQDTATAFVEVSGNGEAAADPDMVRISFAVETLQETAREASEENAIRMNAVIEALRSAGISNLRIETFGYNLQPNYRRPTNNDPGPVEVENYRATNNIRVTSDAVDAAGAIIDEAIQAGANRVASLTFEVADKEPVRSEALRAAVGKAEAEARTIAEALGVSLGAPIEVRGGAEQPVFRQEMMRMSAADAATPIEAGEQTITASVTIRYRLGGPQR